MFAYSFDSDLNPGQVLAKLNQTGPWEWVERDNDSWGWYISAAPLDDPHYAIVKVIFERPRAVNVRFESDADNADALLEDLRRTLLERLLPALGARNVAPTDTYE